MITKKQMANGSYGIYSRAKNSDSATIVNVWFCGGEKPGVGLERACAHATRREAEGCANRDGKQERQVGNHDLPALS